MEGGTWGLPEGLKTENPDFAATSGNSVCGNEADSKELLMNYQNNHVKRFLDIKIPFQAHEM